MQIIETANIGKRIALEHNEDFLVVTEHFAAVVDGATTVGGRHYLGMTPGRFAGEALCTAIAALDPLATADQSIDALSEALRLAGVEAGHPGIPRMQAPTAAVACFSAARRELWRVGDTHLLIGDDVYAPSTLIDTIAASTRAMYDRMLLASGTPPSTIAVDDPGRELVLPMLRLQTCFQNSPDVRHEFARGVIDGRTVPTRFREVWQIPEGTEIVLASDGYPDLCATLEESEARLAEVLATDPMRVSAENPGVKGVSIGDLSFDDRSYLRLVA